MATNITISTGGTTTVVTVPETQNNVTVSRNQITTDERTKLAGIEAGATADMTGAEIKAAYEAEPNAFTDALKTKLDTIEVGATADQSITTTDGLSGGAASGNVTLTVDGTVVRTTGNQSIAGTKTFTGSLSVNGAYDFPTTIGSATQVLKVNSAGNDLEFGDASVVAVLNDLSDVSLNSQVPTGQIHERLLLFDPSVSKWRFLADVNTALESPVADVANISFASPTTLGAIPGIKFDGANDALSINSTVSYGASGVNLFVDGKARIDGAIEVSSGGTVEYSLPAADGTSNQLLATNGSGAVTFVTPSVTTLSDVTSAGSGAIITSSERTKLTGIEASADVTDTANVTAAGALMDSEVTNLAQVKAFDSSDYATAAQGSTADSALQNISEDTSPQLGGNLDVNGNDIVSTSNADIELDPNGTGKVVFKGNSDKGAGQFVLNCEQNSHGIVIKGPPHSANASYTLTLPNTDGSANQVLKTDGSGNLDWVAQTSDTNTQNTTTLSFVDSSDDIILRNTTGGAGSGTQDITINAGSNITLTHTDANNITIAAAGSSGSSTFVGLSDTPGSFTASKFLKVNSAGNAIEFVDNPSGGLSNIVEDTTPQLGGNLDVNGNKIVSTSNGDIDIEPNGTGDVLLGNFKFDADQTVGSGQDNYVLTYDNSSGKISLEASAGGGGGLGGADQTLTADRTIDTNGYNLDIELDSSGTADTFTIHDGTHDLFQVDTGTTGTIFSVNDVSGLPKLTVDDSDGVTIDKLKQIKYEKPSNTDFSYQGDVVYFGATTSMTQGDLYYYNSSGNWAQADADAASSSGGVLLAIALGTASDTNGMLLKGTFTMAAGAIDGTEATGDELYVSTTAGHVTSAAPTATGDIVRVVGYMLDGTNGQIWFNPSNDFITLA